VQDALRWFGFGKKVKPARMGCAWCGTRRFKSLQHPPVRVWPCTGVGMRRRV